MGTQSGTTFCPRMSHPLPAFSATPAAPDRLGLIATARRSVLLEGQVCGGIAPWIQRSWQRCLALGRRADEAVAFDAVSAADIRRITEHNQPLIRAAQPTLHKLARAMADTRYFAILTNAQGVVVTVDGPIDPADPRATAIARVGVDLSEGSVGTTAIGAALAEQQPVWLHRGEHFFDANGHYSCAGAPLWGPQGECVGMLDLTGVDVAERPALKHLVTQSARSIENALVLEQPHALLLRLNWPGQHLGEDSDGLLCVDSDGFVVGRNRAASDMLAIAQDGLRLHCSDLFALPWEHLFDAAQARRAASEKPLWSGLRLQVLASLNGDSASGRGAGLKDIETALIKQAVQAARGNVMEAARALGISRATVYRKLGRRN
jgi:transcriptional regulator of acetoin/glycerol metabolism